MHLYLCTITKGDPAREYSAHLCFFIMYTPFYICALLDIQLPFSKLSISLPVRGSSESNGDPPGPEPEIPCVTGEWTPTQEGGGRGGVLCSRYIFHHQRGSPLENIQHHCVFFYVFSLYVFYHFSLHKRYSTVSTVLLLLSSIVLCTVPLTSIILY
jgi:hypothetical protein